MKHESRFPARFELLTGHAPFPWQERLYKRLIGDDIPETCLIPTGLGKTSVIAIWLLALAAKRGRGLPRRLVYVVNRRTVVDQTTHEVERLRDNLPLIPELATELNNMCALDHGNPLAISTLRGQFADNQEWSTDPARPAVICGTVDMIGSRLLFSGYRCGFKSRPMQAGFLGQDALLVHDESHLEPAFQKLVEEICEEQRTRSADAHPLRVMALSATAKSEGEALQLDDADRENRFVQQRIHASKDLHLHPIDDKEKELVERLSELALEYQGAKKSVVVFARSVETVEKVASNIEKELRKQKFKDVGDRVAVLTGTMRGLERNRLTKRPIFKRFVHGSEGESIEGTVYLICTSAGEVGVNISADHLVCDLSTFESMAQRFGRVNRFGECADTEIHVVHPTEFDLGKGGLEPARAKTLQLLQRFNGDASPNALKLSPDERKAAFAPDPKFVDTSDILFDAWANTSVKELPGRPSVDEFLHGIADWEPPRTEIAWRDEVNLLSRELLTQLNLTADELLADYPLKPHEVLSDRSDRIYDNLKKLLDRIEKEFHSEQRDGDLPEIPVWVIENDEKIQHTTLQAIAQSDKKQFSPHTVMLPPAVQGDGMTIQVGGLAETGLFDHSSKVVRDVADLWQNEDEKPDQYQRVRQVRANEEMRLIRSINLRPNDQDGIGASDDGEQPDKIWYWYAAPQVSDDDASRSAKVPIPWPHHTNDVIANAKRIANTMLVDTPELQAAMILAARFHDFGKRRVIWQRSIGNPHPTKWHEKSGKAKDWGRLVEITRYRHEFGSLLNLLHPQDADVQEFAEAFSEFAAMSEEQQDVVLHLIAVHHGRGRPHFPIEEAFDPDYAQALADELSIEVPRRFARLQRRFGRWGLAWLESLFRAADYAASSNPSIAQLSVEVTA